MNTNKNQVKSPQTLGTVGATNRSNPNFSNRDISGNASTWFEKLSKPAKYGMLASGPVVSAVLGILVYHLANSLFGSLARGKKFFIQYCKYFKPHGIKLSGRELEISCTHYDEFYKEQVEGYIRFNTHIDENFKSVMNSKLEGEALNKARINFRNCVFPFYVYYNFKLKTDFYNIAAKNGINICSEKQENFIDFYDKVVVRPNNGKLSVCFEKTIVHEDKPFGNPGKYEVKDITAEFNIANPKTQEEKNRKNFYDALVKYFNNDDVAKQILINN